jgi:hypothetical protein
MQVSNCAQIELIADRWLPTSIAYTCSLGIEKLHCLHVSITERTMRKVTILGAPIAALALVAALWPTAHPDVERFGDSVYETIWLWRVPAYANNPAWRVRWSWSDPLRAQARCCRALSPSASGPGDDLQIVPSAGQPRARLVG